MLTTVILLTAFALLHSPPTSGEGLEETLAVKNAMGLPVEMLLEAMGSRRRGMDDTEDNHWLEQARQAALKYLSERAGGEDEVGEGMCQYAWVAWLPFSGCSQPPSREVATPFTSIDHTSCSP